MKNKVMLKPLKAGVFLSVGWVMTNILIHLSPDLVEIKAELVMIIDFGVYTVYIAAQKYLGEI